MNALNGATNRLNTPKLETLHVLTAQSAKSVFLTISFLLLAL
jgi:hypothetical protein